MKLHMDVEMVVPVRDLQHGQAGIIQHSSRVGVMLTSDPPKPAPEPHEGDVVFVVRAPMVPAYVTISPDGRMTLLDQATAAGLRCKLLPAGTELRLIL